MEPERGNQRNDEKSIIGTWRLVSFDAEDQVSGERWPTFISKWAPSPFNPGRTTRGIIEFEREA